METSFQKEVILTMTKPEDLGFVKVEGYYSRKGLDGFEITLEPFRRQYYLFGVYDNGKLLLEKDVVYLEDGALVKVFSNAFAKTTENASLHPLDSNYCVKFGN